MDGEITVAIFNFDNQGGDEGLKDKANYVEIKHENGFITRYVHLQFESIPPVKVGDKVTTETRIGFMGNTGWSTGPHLHLTVMKNKRSVNPANYLPFTKANIKGEQMIEYCGKNIGEDEENQDDWLYDKRNSGSIKARFKKTWLGVELESIKLADPRITRTVQASDFGEDDTSKYYLYAITPYTGQQLQIEIYENGKLIESKEEKLQYGAYWGRKNTLSPYDEDIFGEMENKSVDGRIRFEVFTKWSVDPSWNNGSKVTMQDELWVDTKIKHKTSCSNSICAIPNDWKKYLTEKPSNRVRLDENTKKLSYDNMGIEKWIGVDGNRSDTSGQIKSPTRDRREVRFILVGSDENRKRVLYKLPKGGKVWIISHGWNGGLDKPTEIANTLLDSKDGKNFSEYNPDTDALLVLDWRDVSHNGSAVDFGMCRVSTWSRPLAEEIKKFLDSWSSDFDRENEKLTGDRLTLIGHSMGTILNSEISRQYSNSSKLVLLDPPADPCAGGYNVENNPKGDSQLKKQSFATTSEYSRSFVGIRSVAGSQDHAKTAHNSIGVDYKSWLDFGDEHGKVPVTWNKLISYQQVEEYQLNAKDMQNKNWPRKEEYSDHNAHLESDKDSGDVNRLKYYDIIENKEVIKNKI